MLAKSIKIKDFRNVTEAEAEFHPELTVLRGDNAQGKTNMLEAVFAASWGKSFRAQRESDLIREGAASASVCLRFESAGREQEILLRFFRDPQRRREIEINGVPQKRAGELYGRFAAVLFVPAHLEIVRGSPDERRRFLDMALAREKPAAITLMNNYRRALEQRNRVLKDSRLFPGLEDLLAAWDGRLAQLGAELSAQRAAFCARLSAAAGRVYAELAQGEEFAAEFEHGGGGLTADEFAEALARSRADDLRVGYTTVGAHRDDLKIAVAGRDGRRFASQGQQRSAVIALKLAEAELLRESAGEPPVLLLDDVLSELDAGRKEFLLSRVSGMQRIVTACDGSEFEGGAVYRVQSGRFERE